MAALFGGGQSSPPPTPKPIPPMPDIDGPEAMEAAKRKRMDVLGRSGRSSTLLSQAMNTGDYGKQKLGG